MEPFTVYDSSTAPEAARAALAGVQSRMGSIPNLLGAVAEAPLALSSYLQLMQTAEKSSLSGAERQVIDIAVSVENGCGYCVAAHSALARAHRMPAELIDASRSAEPLPDRKLEALRQVARTMVRNKGFLPEEVTGAFFAAGYTKSQMLEVMLVVITRMLANYAHAITRAPLDEAFRAYEWSPRAT